MQRSTLVMFLNNLTPLQRIYSHLSQQNTLFQQSKSTQILKNSSFHYFQCSQQDISSKCQDNDSQQESCSKRRKRGSYRKYTLQQKQMAVQKIMLGQDVKQISKKYGIPRRNLLRWKKNGCQRKQGGGRPTDSQLQTLLYQKILNDDIKNQKQIRQEAKKLSKSSNFKASKGWYCKFNRRFINWNFKTQQFQSKRQIKNHINLNGQQQVD